MTQNFVPPFVGGLDLGTQSIRFNLFDSQGSLVVFHQVKQTIYNPQPGWAEHQPKESLHLIDECIDETIRKLEPLGYSTTEIKGIGLTNHRESVVAWNPRTGEPLYNSILWLDTRTTETCEKLEKEHGGQDAFRSVCGLPISTYFSGVKLRWILDHVPAVVEACHQKECLFGTIDSWVIWNLTGGIDGGKHLTDVTNASRTMLMDLHTQEWSEDMCRVFGIPMETLGKIISCSEVYGRLTSSCLKGIPLAGCLGDQQAALLGQRCLNSGDVKNTYGTGCFLLVNTGTKPVISSHGLLTTVGYKLGPNVPTCFSLEGSVATAGMAVTFLVDNLHMADSPQEVDQLASSVSSTGGVYFVPAFSGLFAPHWRSDARGTIVGMSQYTTRAHISLATLESAAFQTTEVLDAVTADMRQNGGDDEWKISRLIVDGGMTKSQPTMQTQANLLGIPVVCPKMKEATALGSAFAAGLAVGVWKGEKSLPNHPEGDQIVYESVISDNERTEKIEMWKKAVHKSFDWV